MIVTCRANGVRVYADAVVNHMSGGGNDVLNHRGSGSGNCDPYGAKNSTAGSPYYTHSRTYQYSRQTGLKPAVSGREVEPLRNRYSILTEARSQLEFPAVPYGPTDFHCDRVLNQFTDPFQLQFVSSLILC